MSVAIRRQERGPMTSGCAREICRRIELLTKPRRETLIAYPVCYRKESFSKKYCCFSETLAGKGRKQWSNEVESNRE